MDKVFPNNMESWYYKACMFQNSNNQLLTFLMIHLIMGFLREISKFALFDVIILLIWQQYKVIDFEGTITNNTI